MQKLLLTYPKNPQCNTRNYPFARRRSMSSGQDPVSDERNPVNGGIRPYRIADHIDGHISLSGDDLQARFLDGISKKIVPLDPDDIFVIGLFLLLTGRMDHQDTGDIF